MVSLRICHTEHRIAPAQKKTARGTATAKNAPSTIKQRTNGHIAQGKLTMAKNSKGMAEKQREKIQRYFWSIVGSVEHITLPKLEDAVKKEFNTQDDRLIQAQINLMQSEARIRIESNVKVWIKQPENGE
jgi:hypothetical protein